MIETVASTAALGTAFYFSWKLTLVIVASFPFAGIILYFISRRLTTAIENQKIELTQASKFANTAISAIDTVKAFNGQDQEVWQYYSAIKCAGVFYLAQAKANALQFAFTKFVLVAIFVQGFWYGISLVDKGLDPGHVLTTFYSCLTAMQAIEVILPQWLVLSKGISAGQTLKSIMSQVERGRKVTRMDGSMKPELCCGDIEIKEVSNYYSNTPEAR